MVSKKMWKNKKVEDKRVEDNLEEGEDDLELFEYGL